MSARAQWRKQYIESVSDCKRIRSPIERPFSRGIEDVIARRQCEIKGWRLYPEVRLDIRYKVAINLDREARYVLKDEFSKLTHTIDGGIRLFGCALWSLAGRTAFF